MKVYRVYDTKTNRYFTSEQYFENKISAIRSVRGIKTRYSHFKDGDLVIHEFDLKFNKVCEE